MSRRGAVVGVSDHGGWAIFVTVAPDGTFLDRRRVELVDDNLPAIPHHHEAQLLPANEGVTLVERVQASAEQHALVALDAVAAAVPHITCIALRARPKLPPTIAERIKERVARNVADWAMYREAIASAAEARGWRVHWFEAKAVADAAGALLRVDDFESYFLGLRSKLGPPWNADHRIALGAAIVASFAADS